MSAAFTAKPAFTHRQTYQIGSFATRDNRCKETPQRR